MFCGSGGFGETMTSFYCTAASGNESVHRPTTSINQLKVRESGKVNYFLPLGFNCDLQCVCVLPFIFSKQKALLVFLSSFTMIKYV
jgi:hypothetical protein